MLVSVVHSEHVLFLIVVCYTFTFHKMLVTLVFLPQPFLWNV